MKPTASTTEQIRSATLHLLERGGREAVSMRRIARAVGITPMAIYHHFPNREALIEAVTNAEFERLAQFWREANRPSERVLLGGLLGYLDYALTHPELFDHLFSRRRPGSRQFPADFRARKSPTLNLVADDIRSKMEAGKLRRDDVWEVALAAWSLAHGLIVLYRAGRVDLPEQEFRALYRRSMKRLIHGLRV